MDGDVAVERAEDPQPPVPVGPPERGDQLGPPVGHGRLLQPVPVLLGQDQDHLRAAVALEAFGQRRGHPAGGKILVLDIDIALGALDRGKVERLHLTGQHQPVDPRIGAGDGDVDLVQVDADPLRPKIFAAAGDPGDLLPGRPEPAFAGELAQRRRRFAVEGDLHVVERGVGLTGGVGPPGVVQSVLGRVPAPRAEVDPANERQRVVDDDDLLVMAGPDRVDRVQAVAQPAVGHQAEPVVGEQLPVAGKDDGEVPGEDVDVQPRPVGDQMVEKLAELIGRRHIVPVRLQPNPAVHVPTDDDDRPARPQRRRLEGGEIGGRVDQEGDPMRAQQPPTGLAFDEKPILPGTRSRSRAVLAEVLEKICLCHGRHAGIGAP